MSVCEDVPVCAKDELVLVTVEMVVCKVEEIAVLVSCDTPV